MGPSSPLHQQPVAKDGKKEEKKKERRHKL